MANLLRETNVDFNWSWVVTNAFSTSQKDQYVREHSCILLAQWNQKNITDVHIPYNMMSKLWHWCFICCKPLICTMLYCTYAKSE